MDLKLELEHKEVPMPKNWCFWTVCWRTLLRVPWIARRSNYPILKEINPEHSSEGLMLKLKLQYFGYLMWKADIGTLMLGKIEGRRRRGQQRRRWLDGLAHSMDMSLSRRLCCRRLWRTGKPGVLQSWGSQRDGHDCATEQQQTLVIQEFQMENNWKISWHLV